MNAAERIEAARWYLRQGDRELYAAAMVALTAEIYAALEDVRGAIRADRTQSLFSDMGTPGPVHAFEVAA